MANSRNIASYDPSLIQIIHLLARTHEPRSIALPETTPSQAITFASRYSTLRQLLVEQAEKEGNSSYAARIGAVKLRRNTYIEENGRKKTTSWRICNPEEANKGQFTEALRAEVDKLLEEEMGKMNTDTNPTFGNPMDAGEYIPDPSDEDDAGEAEIRRRYGLED